MAGRIFLFGALLVMGVSSHEWGLGSCPTVAPMPNLSLDKFLGLWYVIEQFDTTSTCLTLDFERTSETSLQVTKHRQFYILDRAGLDHTNSYTGTIDIPFSNNQGLLRIKWPLNAAGKSDFVIFDTDYETYAGIYDCQQIAFFMYRESAAILSRTSSLDTKFVEKIKGRLESYKVDVEEFSKIDHGNCRRKEDSDLNINVDENTFNKVISNTADTLKGAADTLADGVKNLTTTVVEGVKHLSTNEEVKEAAKLNVSPDLNDVELLN